MSQQPDPYGPPSDDPRSLPAPQPQAAPHSRPYGQQYGQQPPPGQYGQQGQYGQYPAQGGYGAPNPYAVAGAPGRPGTVTAGCVLAWIGGAVGVLLSLALVVVAADVEARSELGLTGADGGLVAGIGVGYGLWNIVVIILAVLAFRGSKGSAIALLAMGGLMSLLLFLGVVSGEPTGLVAVAWIVVSSVLLYGATSSRQWFSGRSAGPSPAPGGYAY